LQVLLLLDLLQGVLLPDLPDLFRVVAVAQQNLLGPVDYRPQIASWRDEADIREKDRLLYYSLLFLGKYNLLTG
jgi:hypothetical protein